MTDPSEWALGYFSSADGPFAGIVVGDRVRNLTGDAAELGGIDAASPEATRVLLESWATHCPTLATLAAQSDGGSWLPLDSLDALAPLAPRQILQAGANYRKHVVDLAVAHTDIAAGRTEAEVRADATAMMDKRKAEGVPYIFIGLPSAITGPLDEVTLPAYSERHDWELELAAVIGATAYRISPETALEHVAAYTIANDLTTRDLVFRRDMPEIGSDWFRAKNAPGFLPLGPWLVPAESVSDPQALTLTLTLNGDVMQNESSADMLFTVAEIVSAASQTTTLLPGDLILTGSPAGNGAHWGRLLRDGDIMVSTITGLGRQRTLVKAEARHE
ncbi:fumarylacetoacetate hydrolase family protein [Microbacterium sp. STN6]|uniref:fumarylacetoacetate hydrolase family protein n=1 Tax=Microbacterium sp. STN6 TaxID=2995588 RepID=UPI002260CF82|nr:fumarylacetoacetate hydrolase family protein [Microbacterium sp. STN6]MCX7522269.1 fumarylacetoacetate hydrolase family protein [Microbacterium sp. STN6]